MRFATLLSVTALTLVAGIGTASAADQFATLKGIEAEPMSANELDAVKGLHFHFMTPAGKLLFVNVKNGALKKGEGFQPTPNADVASDGFPLGVGKGYRGLCGAALRATGLSIPGQDPVTGIGGGC